jgi:tRNA-dihydrouridine synthase B
VVRAVSVPVTLKMRTGWDSAHRNGAQLARIAEQAGIAAIAVHGRTRACGFSGAAEYDTIRAVRQAVAIPVIANGDIDSAEKAAAVLAETGASGIMVGRAARGRPWLFDGGGTAPRGARAPRPAARALRRGAGGAHRAQARRLVCEVHGWFRRIPRTRESRRDG